MTARDMFYEATPTATTAMLFTDDRMGIRDDMFLIVTSTAADVVNVIYKNHGWYSTGSVFEVWVTSGSPQTIPPSGHTLSDVDFVVLQG